MHSHIHTTGEKKGIHHRVYHHVRQHKGKWLVGVLCAVIIVLVIMFFVNVAPKGAKKDNTVRVDYIGYLDDGMIFDTSFEAVANEANILNPSRKYEPLEFKIGSGMVLKDFENAVVGMLNGESKSIKISGDKAYPLINLPKTITIKNAYTIPVKEFEGVVAGGKAELGKEYILPQVPWKVKITDLNTATGMLTFASEAKKGEVFILRQWNATILDINEENITLFQDVPNDVIISLPDGRTGKVVKTTDSEYFVDFVYPIGGRDLFFNITLVEIKK